MVTITDKGLNAMVVNNQTATRFNVISTRINDTTLAMGKAMMIEMLKQQLRTGVAHFIFMKKNGELREIFATTNKALVQKHIVGTGESREHFYTTALFDVEKGAWRSFRWESIISIL